ncbi:MAG: oxidoreductase family protein [Dehalococcoidia bacterium]
MSLAEPEQLARSGDGYRSWWKKISGGIASEFPDGVFDIADKLAAHFEVVMRPTGESPITLNHGDSRPGNLFFQNRNGTSEVVRIDWQGTSSSRGATELAYFVLFSIPVDQRRLVEDSLLRLYLRVLTENGVRDYSYDRLTEDYRRGLFQCLFICVLALANLDFDSEGGRAIIDEVMPRLAALTDWDCGALIPD